MLTAAIIGLVILISGSVAYNVKQHYDKKSKDHDIRAYRTQINDGDRLRSTIEDNLARLTAASNAMRERMEAAERQIDRYKARNDKLKTELNSRAEQVSTLENKVADLVLEFEQNQIDQDSGNGKNDQIKLSTSIHRINFSSENQGAAKDEQRNDPAKLNVKQ
jgi:chromosome segregation ATPase